MASLRIIPYEPRRPRDNNQHTSTDNQAAARQPTLPSWLGVGQRKRFNH